MKLRNFYDFKDAKEIYLERVLYHINYRKLRKRIKEEIENHMDDMYDDFKNDFDNEIDIAKKVIDEMGDPDELGLELKEANRRILRVVKFFRVMLVLSIIPCLILCQTVGLDIIDEVRIYNRAEDISTIEAKISEEYNNGEPIRLFAEADLNGKVHKYYVSDEQPKGRFKYFHTESIIIFGKSYKDKFLYFGGGSGPYSDGHKFNLSEGMLADYLLVLTAPTEEKYIKMYLEPIYSDSGLKPYWSDFVEYPQNGTYENPATVVVDIPDGYHWSYYKRFDENKELIVLKIPEQTTNTTDFDSNGISVHSSTVTH